MSLRFVLPISLAVLLGGGLFAGFHSANTGEVQKGEKRVEADQPDEALKWRRLAWVDENGHIPPNALQKAEAQMRTLASGSAQTMAIAQPWVEIGPANVAGRSRSLLVHPSQPNKLWMGAVGGGIWKSVDYGASWAPVSDRLTSLAIGSMAMDPNDSNVMYAGTGEGFFNGDSIGGAGILQSVDGGDTWNLLPGTATFGNVNRVAVQPGNGAVLLAAMSAYNNATTRGIYRSRDAGVTWKQVIPGQIGAYVAFDPTNGANAIASLMGDDGAYHAYYSRNGGSTWTQTALWGAGFDNRIELAYAPGNTKIVYAVVGGNPDIYKSVDGGINYALVSSPALSGYWWYDNCLWVDPTNSNRIVVGGVNLYRSNDGGANFDQISSGYILTDQAHPDVHGIVSASDYDGYTKKRVYVVTDGGAFVTDDITTVNTAGGWKSLANNARTSQYYGADGEAISGRYVGGLQDNGTLVVSRGNLDAHMMFGGDGGFSAVDPINPDYMYGEYVGLTVHRSTDGGQTADWIYSGIADAGSAANFIAPIALDKGNPSNLYAGGAHLWRTMNARAAVPTWQMIKDVEATNISAICVATNHSNIVWIGYNDGRVFKSENATWNGPSWTAIDNNGSVSPLPDRYVTRIVVDATDTNTAYVAFGGFTPDNLWVTHDGGVTWSTITGSGSTALPAAPIRGIARDPKNKLHLIVGTEVGVCETTDGGGTWSTPAFGPANVSVDEVTYVAHSHKVLVATHGRGLWLYGATQPIDLTIPISTFAGQKIQVTVLLDGVAPAGGYRVSLSSSSSALSVPGGVTIPEGSDQATFTATANGVNIPSTVVVAAYLNGGKTTGETIVYPAAPTITSKVSVASVIGGSTSVPKLVVTSSQKAPSGGFVVDLSSQNTSVATVPATLTIPAGSTVGSVPITTYTVSVKQTVSFHASIGNQSADASLIVYPPKVIGLKATPSQIRGGSNRAVTGTVTLSLAAPAGGVQVALASGNVSLLAMPDSVTVPAGMTTVNFPITTFSVNSDTTVPFTATTGVTTKTGFITLLPPGLVGFKLSPSTTTVNSTVVATATITSAAPDGGLVLQVANDKPEAVTAPSTAFFQPGSTTASFVITTKAVNTATDVTFTVSINGTIRTAVLHINP